MPTPKPSYPGYVYLIGSIRFGWYKIGKSRRVQIRITDIGVLLPFRVEVFAIWGTSDEGILERELHDAHRLHRINGEWFAFDDNTRRAVIVRNSVYPSTLLFDKRMGLDPFLPANMERDVERGSLRATKLLMSAAYQAAVDEWLSEKGLDHSKVNRKIAKKAISSENWRFSRKLNALQIGSAVLQQ